jgi:hypothetical protein
MITSAPTRESTRRFRYEEGNVLLFTVRTERNAQMHPVREIPFFLLLQRQSVETCHRGECVSLAAWASDSRTGAGQLRQQGSQPFSEAVAS